MLMMIWSVLFYSFHKQFGNPDIFYLVFDRNIWHAFYMKAKGSHFVFKSQHYLTIIFILPFLWFNRMTFKLCN